MTSDQSTTASERIPPLNLTEEEADYLWEMIKREIGKEEVYDRGDADVVSSLHTKIGEATDSFDSQADEAGDRDD